MTDGENPGMRRVRSKPYAAMVDVESALGGTRRALCDALVALDCDEDRRASRPAERRRVARQALLVALRNLEHGQGVLDAGMAAILGPGGGP